jgi:hypothetical protein
VELAADRVLKAVAVEASAACVIWGFQSFLGSGCAVGEDAAGEGESADLADAT